MDLHYSVALDLGQQSVLAPLVAVELTLLQPEVVYNLLEGVSPPEAPGDLEDYVTAVYLSGLLYALRRLSVLSDEPPVIDLRLQLCGAGQLNHFGVHACVQRLQRGRNCVFSWRDSLLDEQLPWVQRLALAQALHCRRWVLQPAWLRLQSYYRKRRVQVYPHLAGEMSVPHARYLRSFQMPPPGYIVERLWETWPAKVKRPTWLT